MSQIWIVCLRKESSQIQKWTLNKIRTTKHIFFFSGEMTDQYVFY